MQTVVNDEIARQTISDLNILKYKHKLYLNNVSYFPLCNEQGNGNDKIKMKVIGLIYALALNTALFGVIE